MLKWILTVVLAGVRMMVTALGLGTGLAAQAPAVAAPRFDMVVRNDFFAGFAGDAERLAAGMATCERELAVNPDRAEALVWHGSGLVFQAGGAFRRGEAERGGVLWQRGLDEMQRAVALAPDSVGVRIPRGAVLLQATRNMPEAQARPILELAVGDYERVLAIQAPVLSTLSEHARGQLLYGLAEGSARLGRLDQARRYFSQLVSDAPESPLTPRARQWLTDGRLPPEKGLGCVGCHK